MKTMILCGGQGTRMREETEYRPKPLVDIGGKPILWHIMKIYAQAGFREFVLCLGYKGHQIKEYFLQYHAMNHDFTLQLGERPHIKFHNSDQNDEFSVTLADTGLQTMTGGRIRLASQYIDTDTFLVTYGDGLADIDIAKLVDFHHSHGKLATVTTMRPVSRFGIVDIEADGQVRGFAEKPQSDAWASAGFFVLNRKVVELLDSNSCIFEDEPIRRLTRDGQLMAYRHEGFFFAMDTYREYLQLNQLWVDHQAPWKIW